MSEPIDYWLRLGIRPHYAFTLSDGTTGFCLVHFPVKIGNEPYVKMKAVTLVEPSGLIRHYTELNLPQEKVTKIVEYEYREDSALEDLLSLKNEVTSRGK
jgi:hypothetical protein